MNMSKYYKELATNMRIERASGSSCYVRLVKYDAGVATILTTYQEKNEAEEMVNAGTSVYYTECTIQVWTEGTKLHGKISTDSEKGAGMAHTVELEADVEVNPYGGMMMYYNSSTGDNTTYIGSMHMTWAKGQAQQGGEQGGEQGETPAAKYVYLNAGVWDVENVTERYAAYFFKSSEVGTESASVIWANPVSDANGVYKFEVLDGFDMVIFVRMDGASTENAWGYKWNQTGNLSIADYIGKTFTINAIGENGADSTGTWGDTAPAGGEQQNP